jgi:uncharacterized membrane protein
MFRPIYMFLILSGVFGPLLIGVVPPMRGPDEPAHFVRTYSVSQGDLIPTRADEQGRKGTLLSLRPQKQIEVFELARDKVNAAGFAYGPVFESYEEVRRASVTDSQASQLVFNLYGGSEAYSPIPYLPYLPAGLVARLLALDFLPTLYLMRLTGFAALTALITYAIAVIPRLKWSFLAIAMLPSALYGRVVVSGDGMTLALTMVLVALCLRRLYGIGLQRQGVQAVGTWLCVLCKPSQIVFVALPITGYGLRDIHRRWCSLTAVICQRWCSASAGPCPGRLTLPSGASLSPKTSNSSIQFGASDTCSKTRSTSRGFSQ